MTKPIFLPASKPYSAEAVLKLVQDHPLSNELETFDYGTAGFRYNAKLLPGVMVRVGFVAAIRACQSQQAVGVMVTASHNDESYNGVKVADPDGGMLQDEALAIEIANERNLDHLRLRLEALLEDCKPNNTTPGMVHLGRDTRSHSAELSDLTCEAILAMGVAVLQHGVVTTPMLHHAVLHSNSQYLPLHIPIRPNRSGYINLLAQAYVSLLDTILDKNTSPELSPLIVDGACGVGYGAVQELIAVIQELSPNSGRGRIFQVKNGPGDGPLNEGCGSEVVQKKLQPPTWYQTETDGSSYMTPPWYAASLDGDADRIVFFSQLPTFQLVDGDKIAVLICEFLQEQIECLYQSQPFIPRLSLGVVQTAYANGASTKYLQVWAEVMHRIA